MEKVTIRNHKEKGYEYVGYSYQRGYVSRKINQDDCVINNYVSRGRRSGLYYAVVPCFCSTQYCIRHYFRKVG